MIWFDLITPKSVLFFDPIIREIKKRGKKVLITAREGVDYKEVVGLLKLRNIEFVNRGEFGGAKLYDKLRASLERQKALMEYISLYNIRALVCLCSVDANRVAFGLGIPIINFYDIPLSDYTADFKKALPQARLTLPLSTKVFRPFVVPEKIFLRFSLEKDQIYSYNFIDPLIWLEGFKPDYKFMKNIAEIYKIDLSKPLIVVREEEYKASYVERKYPFLYEALPEIHRKYNANIVIVPRYESDYLEKEFNFAIVLKEKIKIQHLLAYADLFIGGGGTMNTEACFLGTPTISTRSFICHYDKFQIDKGIMTLVTNKEELLAEVDKLLGKRFDSLLSGILSEMNVNIKEIVDIILEESGYEN